MHRVLIAFMRPARAIWLAAFLALLATAGCNLDFVGVPTPAASVSGAPVVTIASPLPDSVYLPGVDVIIQARITNAGPGIARVEFAVDGATILSLDDPNPSGAYAFSAQTYWEATGPGPHTLTIAAVRADGTRSQPATLTFRVAGAELTTSPTPEATATVGVPILPTLPPTTTPPPAAASTATTAPAETGGTLTGTFIQTLNVRSGPGLAFNPPIGSFTAGQTTDVLARSPGSDWYKVRYLNGEGWVYAQLVTLNGDASTLPVDAGPPAPTPTTAPAALPLPATNTPQTTANLAGGVITFNPSQPECAQTFTVSLDVANLGTAPTAASGSVTLTDTRASDGSLQEETTGGFPVLQPGETFRVDMPLTVSTYYNETHRLTLTIDPTNQVPESQDTDNTQTIDFTLQKGTCP
ncbi:MAG: SH3 domain-containing protein [Anaerolineae bacterium]